jgi:uncharacterized protein
VYAAGQPCWVECATPDATAAMRFYGDLLGWTFEPSDPGEPYRHALLDGRRVAGLNPGTSLTPDWRVYLTTDDAAATAARVTELGGTVVYGPRSAGRHGTFLYARDPAGAEIAFREPGESPGLEIIDAPNSPTWYELWVRDGSAADAFYTALFGYDTVQLGDGKHVDYRTYGHGARTYASRFVLAGSGIPDEVSARWMFYLASADCDATFHAAVRAGAKPVREPAASPQGRWAILRDPWGALFALLTRPS